MHGVGSVCLQRDANVDFYFFLFKLLHQCGGALYDWLSYSNAHSQNTTVIMFSFLSLFYRFKV